MTKAAGHDQRRLGTMVDHLLAETKEVLMLPAESLLEIFPAFVRETALGQGKEIELVLEGGRTELDRRVLEEIKDAVVHLVRNSIDHGIETPEARRAAGKPPRGRLTPRRHRFRPCNMSSTSCGCATSTRSPGAMTLSSR